MSELLDLYKEVVIDHGRRPRNFRVIELPSHQANGYNPLCGDRLTLKLRLEGGRIADIGFQGSGCAISTASASTMTEALKGKTVEEANALFDRFHELVTGEDEAPDLEALGKLAVFAGVSAYPMRVKCATLAWHTFKAAVEPGDGQISTE